MRFWCFAKNIAMINGDSAWNKRHGKGHFTGPKWPFGCRVSFMPTPSKLKELPKGSPRMLVGLLVGYNLQPGGEWKGEFAIVPLTAFSSLSLAHDATHPRTHPQLIKEAKMFDKTFVFPLQATYKEHNGTLEGIKKAAVISGESPSAAPQVTLFDVPGEDAVEEPCVGHAYSGGDHVPAKATFIEDTKQEASKTRDDDETSLGTGGLPR
jgi:hypothetical protein